MHPLKDKHLAKDKTLHYSELTLEQQAEPRWEGVGKDSARENRANRANSQSSKIPDACGRQRTWEVHQMPWLSAHRWVAFAIKHIALSSQMVRKATHMKWIHFKSQGGVADLTGTTPPSSEKVSVSMTQTKSAKEKAKFRNNPSSRSRRETFPMPPGVAPHKATRTPESGTKW